MSNEQPGFWGNIGDPKLPSSMWIISISHEIRIPPKSNQDSIRKYPLPIFFRGSILLMVEIPIPTIWNVSKTLQNSWDKLPYQLVVWDIWTINRMLNAEVISACGLSPTPCNNTLMSWRMPRGSAKRFQQTKMDVSKPPRWLRSVETKHCWVDGKTFQSENSWLFSFLIFGMKNYLVMWGLLNKP